MTESETVRRAAALMRARAEAVTSGGQWTGEHYWVTDHDPSDPSGQTPMQRPIGGMDAPDCDHYSSWHPAVALAVADLLDNEASLINGTTEHPDLHMPLNGARIDLLIAVARAYLGTP